MRSLRRVGMRILQVVFVVWATYTLSFLLIRVLPGDPVVAALAAQQGDSTTLDPEKIEALRESTGLSGSLWQQYVGQLVKLLHGDLGTSLSTGRPVAEMIADVLPGSLTIAGIALALGVLVGVLIAFLAHISRWRWLRQLLLQLPPLGVAVPAFLTGLILISVFSFDLHWFPSSGQRSPLSAILPSVTLSLPVCAIFFQVFSAAIGEAEISGYVFTASAKGLSSTRVFFRHVMRNAMMPSMAVIGVLIGYLAGGTAVVETVFSRDGVGRLVVSAVTARDVSVIQGVIVFVSLIYALASLAVELLEPVVDPRLRIEKRAAIPDQKGEGR